MTRNSDLECFQLELGLTHITCEEVELPKFLDPHPGIVVDWVKPLVDLDLEQHSLLPGLVHELLVLRHRLHHRLGGHHVQAALQRRQDDVEVRVVRSEHRANVPRLGELVQSFQVRLRVYRLILNKENLDLSYFMLSLPVEKHQSSS